MPKTKTGSLENDARELAAHGDEVAAHGTSLTVSVRTKRTTFKNLAHQRLSLARWKSGMAGMKIWVRVRAQARF